MKEQEIKEGIAAKLFYQKFLPSNEALAYNLRWEDIPFDGCPSREPFLRQAQAVIDYLSVIGFQLFEPKGEKPPVISELQLEEVYEKAYLKACEFSEKYPTGLSSEHWMPSRPADRQRYFNETSRDVIQRATAEAQRDDTWQKAQALIQQARQEVAREIFEEIEQKGRFVEATTNKVLLGATNIPNAFIIDIKDLQSLKDRFLKDKNL